MTYLFVDTNILLHYRRLEEIDWLASTRADEVTLVLTPVVIRELDKHKDRHPVQKLRNRAREALSDLRSKLGQNLIVQLRERVTLQHFPYDPQIDFRENRLHPDVIDDWLIAAVLEFRQSHPMDSAVIVTADSGIEFKAPAFQIPIIKPSAESALPEEIDPVEKRVKRLERENAELKNALPDLKLVFPDGAKILNSEFSNDKSASIDAKKVMNELRSKYPSAEYPTGSTRDVRSATLGDLAACCIFSKSKFRFEAIGRSRRVRSLQSRTGSLLPGLRKLLSRVGGLSRCEKANHPVRFSAT